MDLNNARIQMINQQLRTWDVLNSQVLDIVRDTPRERFVPERYSQLAFADTEIPLPCGETMLAPKVEGRILQALAIERSDNALVVGAGSGYLTACVAGLAASVVAYERHNELATSMETALKSCGRAGNTEVLAETFSSDTDAGDFDVVAVCGSVAKISSRLKSRLAAGGRLFVVAGTGAIQRATLIRRTGEDDFTTEHLFDTQIAPLVGYEPAERFVF